MKIIHGMARRVTGNRAPEYGAWSNMIQRCHHPPHPYYKYYGARGITVCNEWRNSFEKFIADMGLRPSPKHSLDRIDNAGNYEPGNCRWATSMEQMSNTRRNRLITFRGKTQHRAAWARELGMYENTISQRIAKGWPVELALTTPSNSVASRLITRQLRESGQLYDPSDRF